MLEFENGQITLLDAGEGTSGQLARHYGSNGLRSFYQRLRFVFISHMHADHHSGLAAVLSARLKALGLTTKSMDQSNEEATTLSIACPPQMRTYIRDLDAMHDLQLQHRSAPITFIDNHHLLAQERDDSRYADLYAAFGLTKAETVLVEHRTKAFGLVLQGQAGWKIVSVACLAHEIFTEYTHSYSGDTQPCKALVAAGQDATLLIHEATIEDDMPEVAASKGTRIFAPSCLAYHHFIGHSTFAQAIQVAKEWVV